MIRHVTGTIIDASPTSVVISVAGVGYLVHMQPPAAATPGSELTVWTHHVVRENALDLYGFTTRDELEIFELLLGLPKVGPKSAAQIMAQADITLLKEAVAQEDATYLTKMSGIGKKTAEKIVHELKDAFAERGFSDSVTVGGPTQTWQQETIDALVALGYPQKAAREAVQRLPEEITDTNTALTAALRELST
jgi:Holliday junction DNA helicase RuvA